MDNNNLLNKIVSETVSSIIEENSQTIISKLSQGLNFDKGWEECLAKMTYRSIELSSQLSVQTVIKILMELDIITLDEKALKPNLNLIQGGLGLNLDLTDE